MSDKHTPGPWRLAYKENGELELGGDTTHYTGVFSSVGFGIIAEVIYKTTNILGDSKALQYETFKANAELIAAAPETAAERDHLKERLAEENKFYHALEDINRENKNKIAALQSQLKSRDELLEGARLALESWCYADYKEELCLDTTRKTLKEIEDYTKLKSK